MIRRSIFLTFTLAVGYFALQLAGCADNLSRPEPGSHKLSIEQVSSVLISGDGEKIAVLTPNRHYIFSAPPPLITALNAPYRGDLSAKIGVVSIDRDAKVSVDVTLTMPAASEEVRRIAFANGFKTKFGHVDIWELRLGTLNGRVYKAPKEALPDSMMTLNQTYSVTVSEFAQPYTYSDLPSPIRFIGEGVLGIAALPLALLGLPIAFYAISQGPISVGR